MRKLAAGLMGVLLFATITPGLAKADEVYTFIIKKQEEKAKNRWSLSDWLETRDRMRLMDLWLALHSPSPYEFYVSGAYISGDGVGSELNGSRFTGWDLTAAAYASIFGLGYERESRSQDAGTRVDSAGLFFLRVFGMHAQSTNITLHGGIRSATQGRETDRSALAGVSTTLYIGRYFGLDGLYRKGFNPLPLTRTEGGAFIDFKYLRVYAKYFTAAENPGTQKGVSGGMKFFF